MQWVKHIRVMVAAFPITLAVTATAGERRDSDQTVPKASAVAQSRPQAIQSNDVIQLTISDLGGPGADMALRVRVDAKGNVGLPVVGDVKAEGLTPAELEIAIVKSYRDARLIQNAQVMVRIAGITPETPPLLSDQQRTRIREIEKKAEKDSEAIQGRQMEEMAKLSVKRDDSDLPTYWRKVAELGERTQDQITTIHRQARRDADAIISGARAPATAPGKRPASVPGA